MLVVLHRTLRFQAYVARRVTGAERDRLEGAYLRVQYVLMLNPCLHPPYVDLRAAIKALGEEVTRIPLSPMLSAKDRSLWARSIMNPGSKLPEKTLLGNWSSAQLSPVLV